MAKKSSSNHVLLVEGSNDKHVIHHLLSSREESIPNLCIKNKGGNDPLLKSIYLEVSDTNLKAIGIVMDANGNSKSTWRELAKKLTDPRLAVMKIKTSLDLDQGGTIIEGDPFVGRPRIGIWLMPDNQSPGELEDFIVKMIPNDDPVWPRSTAYITEIPEEDRKFKEGKILRAKVHAWLAAREKPRPMGLAIKTKDLNISVESCQTFVNWLRELFK